MRKAVFFATLVSLLLLVLDASGQLRQINDRWFKSSAWIKDLR